MVYFRVPPSPWVVLLPVILVEEMLFAAALGMLLSAANVGWRDVSRGLPLLLFLLLYAVPVLYAIESVPAAIRPIYDLNPLAFLVDAFRAGAARDARAGPGRTGRRWADRAGAAVGRRSACSACSTACWPMSSKELIALDGVWKRYLLGQGRGAFGILRTMARPASARDHWALRDVSLGVRRGESIALIGRNGAGKTTALRLVAGISKPTQGQVRTEGRVASLLNVGAGFHRELTGRENVFLNGVILGLTRAEVSKRYDEIVDFAGLERFMDTPLKHYSSGMYARLAFAVAAYADPDVLLVDEVLSVGDAAFQDRSLRRMMEFRDQGRTAIVFVSHNLAAVELMCERAVWLDRGAVRASGPTAEVIRAYLDDVDDEATAATATSRT